MGRRPVTFVPAESPVGEPVAKVGGQPVWLREPQWPLSGADGTPMWFIGRIDVPATAQPSSGLAYVFMTDATEPVDDTAEPEGGENAVIIQSSEPRQSHGEVPRLTGCGCACRMFAATGAATPRTSAPRTAQRSTSSPARRGLRAARSDSAGSAGSRRWSDEGPAAVLARSARFETANQLPELRWSGPPGIRTPNLRIKSPQSSPLREHSSVAMFNPC